MIEKLECRMGFFVDWTEEQDSTVREIVRESRRVGVKLNAMGIS